VTKTLAETGDVGEAAPLICPTVTEGEMHLQVGPIIGGRYAPPGRS